MDKYGKILRIERKAHNISQDKLAKAIGVTQAAISQYESDTCEPTISIAIKIADFYGISLDELFHHEIKKNW